MAIVAPVFAGSLHHHAEVVAAGEDPADVSPRSRSAAATTRAPMRWDDSPTAGFTTGTPWIAVNPNHVEINPQAQIAGDDSVFHQYRRLIELRHAEPAVVDGAFRMLLADHEQVSAFTRGHDGVELANVPEPAVIGARVELQP